MELKKKKVIFISGFEKNCGKTTFLNYLLEKYSTYKNVICASIGITSSADEFLNNLYKPDVMIKKGWKVLTNSIFLNKIDVPFIIEDVIDEEVGGGRPVIIKPLYDSYIKLFSPGSNSKIFDILEHYSSSSDFIFIDGAFDRITQVSSFKDASFYYVFKVNPNSIDSVVERIKLFESFSNIPVNMNNYQFMKNIVEDTYYHDIMFVKGALTYQKIEKIPNKIKKIVIMDFTKVFINFSDWIKLLENYSVSFTAHFKLIGYVINLYEIRRVDFEKRFNENILKRFIYNPYEN
ncbi:MAG: hypothetical protein N2Z20_05160 [Elusimicrobiales bacterium]|nr:hypothetical protein [Elusimicrobiales bacterium]